MERVVRAVSTRIRKIQLPADPLFQVVTYSAGWFVGFWYTVGLVPALWTTSIVIIGSLVVIALWELKCGT